MLKQVDQKVAGGNLDMANVTALLMYASIYMHEGVSNARNVRRRSTVLVVVRRNLMFSSLVQSNCFFCCVAIRVSAEATALQRRFGMCGDDG